MLHTYIVCKYYVVVCARPVRSEWGHGPGKGTRYPGTLIP
jgi:hypothetical protein